MRRVFSGVAATLVLALGSAATLSAAPARADGAITTQDYFSALKLKDYRAQGITGKGVRIGLVGGWLDASVPELKGAQVKVQDRCRPTPHSVASITTAAASILVSRAYGWAPDATLTAYSFPAGGSSHWLGACKQPSLHGSLAAGINAALDDQAQVIVLESTSPEDDALPYALARAAVQGVPVVAGAGDDSDETQVDTTAMTNGLIAVGSSDLDGTPMGYSDFGSGLTMLAPGDQVMVRPDEKNNRLGEPMLQTGTAFSAAMVGGALALARQKWPQANGNQLVRSLIENARTDTPQQWNPEAGWGLLNFPAMISEDPSHYPSTNPLLQKVPDGKPTKAQFADYRDGLTNPADLAEDPQYVYRGTNQTIIKAWKNSQPGTSPRYASASPSPLPSPSGAASTAPGAKKAGANGSARPWAWIVGLLVVAVLAGAAAFGLRRRRPARGH